MTAVLSETVAAQDGILSDSELNHFQVHCFAVPLQLEELAGVKAVVPQKMPEVSGASRVLWPLLSACQHGGLCTRSHSWHRPVYHTRVACTSLIWLLLTDCWLSRTL